MSKIDINWLKSEAFRLVKKHWELNEIPKIIVDELSDEEWQQMSIKLTGKPNRLIGLYHNKTKTVELNSFANKNRTKAQIRRTLLHELCHWHLHTNNLPHRDSDIRFALELIKVRAASSCNSDKPAREAMKKAKKVKQSEVFELRDKNYDLDIKLKHNRKTEEEFREDVKNTLIKFYNDNQSDDFDNYVGFSLEDIAHMMEAWYGYKIVEQNVVESISFDSGMGDIGDRDSVLHSIIELGVPWEEAEKILLREKEYV